MVLPRPPVHLFLYYLIRCGSVIFWLPAMPVHKRHMWALHPIWIGGSGSIMAFYPGGRRRPMAVSGSVSAMLPVFLITPLYSSLNGAGNSCPDRLGPAARLSSAASELSRNFLPWIGLRAPLNPIANIPSRSRWSVKLNDTCPIYNGMGLKE